MLFSMSQSLNNIFSSTFVKIESIILLDSAIDIDSFTFSDFLGLKSVNLLNEIKILKKVLLSECDKLEIILILKSIEKVFKYYFYKRTYI
jgi:hypothetical protein